MDANGNSIIGYGEVTEEESEGEVMECDEEPCEEGVELSFLD